MAPTPCDTPERKGEDRAAWDMVEVCKMCIISISELTARRPMLMWS